MQVNRSFSTPSQPSGAAQDSFKAAVAAGIAPVSITGGSLLDETHQLMQSMREAIAAADQGMRGLQVR